MDFSICALLYGPYDYLARRCLDSIAMSATNRVADFRIGLNEVCPATAQYVEDWASDQASRGRTTYVFRTPINRFKYPIMRRMLYPDPPIPKPAELVMWFDDDSYVTGENNWLETVYNAAKDHDMIGQAGWEMPLRERQWHWVMNQPWFNEQVGPPTKGRSHKPSVRFVQGGWWTAKRDFLCRHNYPWPELRHNGGDSMLGEMCRHVGAKVAKFDTGVRINADAEGNHSKAARRGDTSDDRIGANFNQNHPVDLSHQTFVLETKIFAPEVAHAVES